jgi:hypothetical protein
LLVWASAARTAAGTAEPANTPKQAAALRTADVLASNNVKSKNTQVAQQFAYQSPRM